MAADKGTGAEDRAPKVLFAIHQFGSGADGGIRSISEIIRAVPELPKLVVTNIETPITAGLREVAPVEVWRMTEHSYNRRKSRIGYRVSQIAARLANNLAAWRTVRRERVAVLHANDHLSFWNMAPGARLAGAKIIFNVRGAFQPGGPRAALWQRALDLCDTFLLLSEEMAQNWRRDLRPASLKPANRAKFRHLYSIVDRSRFLPAAEAERRQLRAALGIAADKPAILYAGRFDQNKGQLDYISKALPVLKASRPDAITYFVGDFLPAEDSYAAACAAAVERSDLSGQVRFAGYSPLIADWYKAADLVVLASQQEGLPRCMLEGLACGASLVTFDVCSTREILEGQACGVVVPQADYDGLAAAMADLLGDAERRARYRGTGPAVVARLFDKDVNGRLYKDLVQELSGSRFD